MLEKVRNFGCTSTIIPCDDAPATRYQAEGEDAWYGGSRCTWIIEDSPINWRAVYLIYLNQKGVFDMDGGLSLGASSEAHGGGRLWLEGIRPEENMGAHLVYAELFGFWVYWFFYYIHALDDRLLDGYFIKPPAGIIKPCCVF